MADHSVKGSEANWRAWERAWIRSGSYVVDVGANRGTFTVRYADAVGPTGHVLAIEPEAENVAALRTLLREQQVLDRVEIVQAAIGAQAGDTMLYRSQTHTNHSVAASNVPTDERAGGVRVPMLTLDGLDIPDAVRLIKVDVQGAEAALLDGARELLERSDAAWVIEIWPSGLRACGSCAETIWDQMTEAGYVACALEKRTNAPDAWTREHFLSAVSERGGLSYMDLIFLRPDVVRGGLRARH